MGEARVTGVPRGSFGAGSVCLYRCFVNAREWIMWGGVRRCIFGVHVMDARLYGELYLIRNTFITTQLLCILFTLCYVLLQKAREQNASNVI